MPTPIPQALLSDNATRYERFRALPNENTLHIMWTGWAIVTFVSASASALIIVGIMTAPAVRSNVLNIYLVALVFPDFLFSFCCGITCTINAAAPQLGINHVPWMCELQSVYCIFGFVASPWMNAVVGYEVCRLLHANRWALTYMAPTIKVALRNAALVYLWALFVATWTLIPGLPHNANPIGGMACLPVEYDTASSVFFWLVFAPAFLLVPLAFMIFISWRSWREGALRRASHARSLAVFYLRILLIYLLFWGPTIVMVYMVPLYVWVGWAGGTWSHLQGLFSALLCLTKKDVQEAVRQLLHAVHARACCFCGADAQVRVLPTLGEVGVVEAVTQRSIGSKFSVHLDNLHGQISPPQEMLSISATMLASTTEIPTVVLVTTHTPASIPEP
uniref:G-protein coupled receptors family 1 profile domain-containing protein n=1 Tax=Chrysotila carterae TaxID=13221 RepID=A0A7S4B9V0_CHRCT